MVKYHGEVFDSEGREYLVIEGEKEGYAPLVTLKISLISGEASIWLEPAQAAELGRHLVEAAATAES